jgi:hypothetical protein
MGISTATKEAIDKLLNNATREKNSIPGVVYAAINKQGNIIYEGVSGVKSLTEPADKVANIHLRICDTYHAQWMNR